MQPHEQQHAGSLHAPLDRVASEIPNLSIATIKELQKTGAVPNLPVSAVKSLRTALVHAGEWFLNSIDDRTAGPKGSGPHPHEWRHASIDAEIYHQAFNKMSIKLWKALLTEAADHAGRAVLLDRSDQYMTASIVLQGKVLAAGSDLAPSDRTDESIAAGREARRRQILGMLLCGERPPESLTGGDLAVAPTYLILVVPGGQALDKHLLAAREGWYAVKQPTTTALLVPVRDPKPRTLPAKEAHARKVFDSLHLDRPAGWALPDSIKDLPVMLSDAQEVATTVHRLGWHEPKIYRLDDLIFEVTLSRSEVLTKRLADRLEPVAMKTPHLLDTLEAFLNSDCERRELARQLFIHPNTLSYRLKRIAELTGLSLTRTSDLFLLKASLVALRVRDGISQQSGQSTTRYLANASADR